MSFTNQQLETYVLAVLTTWGPQCEVDLRVNVIKRFDLDPLDLSAHRLRASIGALILRGDVFTDDRFWADNLGHHQRNVDPSTRVRYSLTDKYKRGYNTELALDAKLGALRPHIPPGR